MNIVKVLNTSIDNINTEELLDKLEAGGTVYTLNVDHLMKLQKNQEFYDAYCSATYRTCDSQIVKFLSGFLFDSPIKEKISGSDFLPKYFNRYKDDPEVHVFLLGAAEGVGETLKNKVNEDVGRSFIVDSYSPPYGFHTDLTECEYIVERVNNSSATTLVVGLGAPKQEIWIAKYRQRLKKVKVFLAVGAAIDFEAGNLSRAPIWMRNCGLEWLYRLSCEPRRLWKRYLIECIPILWLIPLQFFKLYRPPSFKNEKSHV